MVHDDEVDGGGVVGPLDRGSGDDLPDAAGTAGAEVLDEGLAHGRAEVGGERAGPEREDPIDVGVDPPGVERGDRGGELLDEATVVVLGDDAGVSVVDEGDDTGGGDGDTGAEGDPPPDTRTEEAAESGGDDHGETVPPWRLAGWVAAAVLVLVGAIAFALVGDDDDDDRREVLDVAATFIVDFSSYDHDRFDETLAAVEAASIEAFASRYTTLLGGTGFVDAMRENRASATAEIARGPLLAQFGDDEARVFALVDQTVTSATLDGPQTSRLRIEVILVDTRSGWKVVDVETT